MGPDLHSLAYNSFKIAYPRERPVDSGRGDFERVAAFDRIVNIEHVAQHRTQPLEIVERHAAARTVNQQAQERTAHTLVILDRYQFETLALDVGFEQLGHARGRRMELHDHPASVPA